MYNFTLQQFLIKGIILCRCIVMLRYLGPTCPRNQTLIMFQRHSKTSKTLGVFLNIFTVEIHKNIECIEIANGCLHFILLK